MLKKQIIKNTKKLMWWYSLCKAALNVLW